MLAAVMSKPFYARVAFLGLILYLCVFVVYTVGLIANDEADGLAFVAIAGIPGLVLAYLVLKAKTWTYIVTGLLSLLGFLFFLPGIPVGLSSPDSFIDFFGTIFGSGGLAITIVACILGFLQSRRGDAPVAASPRAVRLVQGIVGAMVVLSAISLVVTIASIEKVSASDKEGATFLTANKTKFDKDTLDFSGGTTMKLVLKNSDPIIHTFTVDDLDMDVRIGPGSEKLIVFESSQAGSYEFRCAIIGHEDMKGTLTIK